MRVGALCTSSSSRLFPLCRTTARWMAAQIVSNANWTRVRWIASRFGNCIGSARYGCIGSFDASCWSGLLVYCMAMNDLAREFWMRMEAAEQKLCAIGEMEARMPYRVGGWTRKQVLGHLVDSACVNHVRVAFAATTGAYAGPSYQQDAWV